MIFLNNPLDIQLALLILSVGNTNGDIIMDSRANKPLKVTIGKVKEQKVNEKATRTINIEKYFPNLYNKAVNLATLRMGYQITLNKNLNFEPETTFSVIMATQVADYFSEVVNLCYNLDECRNRFATNNKDVEGKCEDTKELYFTVINDNNNSYDRDESNVITKSISRDIDSRLNGNDRGTSLTNSNTYRVSDHSLNGNFYTKRNKYYNNNVDNKIEFEIINNLAGSKFVRENIRCHYKFNTIDSYNRSNMRNKYMQCKSKRAKKKKTVKLVKYEVWSKMIKNESFIKKIFNNNANEYQNNEEMDGSKLNNIIS
ncbi:hypothetical protein H8356DRAFT_1353155 [Neocallimastix lanati (nom. inval.)]|nr:hypothetical protein H8356DRAFT_1353155 [Neocallimastix sp. JGI-2020a]